MRNCIQKQTINAVRITYVASQSITVFCQFFGSLVSLLAPLSQTEVSNIIKYAISAPLSVVAAGIFSYTANKFQGIKIILGQSTGPNADSSPQYSSAVAPRTLKSCLIEAIYLILATVLTLANNYFTIAGIKAYFKAFINSSQDDSITPLSIIGITCVLVKTLFFDLPFNFSNASYEAAEQINQDIRGTKQDPCISIIMKPFANKYGIAYIRLLGTFVHTMWDFSGSLLIIKPNYIIALYKSPALFWRIFFWTAFTISIPYNIALFTINLIQTLFFEGEESRKNLTAMTQNIQENWKSHWYCNLLIDHTWLKNLVALSFFTQAPVHGLTDAMPVFLLLGQLLPNISIIEFGVIPIITLVVFLSSTIGTAYSEVRTSIRHFKATLKAYGAERERRRPLTKIEKDQRALEKLNLIETAPVLDPNNNQTQENAMLVLQLYVKKPNSDKTIVNKINSVFREESKSKIYYSTGTHRTYNYNFS